MPPVSDMLMETSIHTPPWLFNKVTNAFSNHTVVELARRLSCTIDILVIKTKPGHSIAAFLYEYCYNRTYPSA